MSRLAQLVERKTLNLVVVGSSPTVGVLFLSNLVLQVCGAVLFIYALRRRQTSCLVCTPPQLLWRSWQRVGLIIPRSRVRSSPGAFFEYQWNPGTRQEPGIAWMPERSKGADLRSAGRKSAWVRTPLQAGTLPNLFVAVSRSGTCAIFFVLVPPCLCWLELRSHKRISVASVRFK